MNYMEWEGIKLSGASVLVGIVLLILGPIFHAPTITYLPAVIACFLTAVVPPIIILRKRKAEQIAESESES